MKTAERRDREEAERRRELERLQPIPLPPKMKVRPLFLIISIVTVTCWVQTSMIINGLGFFVNVSLLCAVLLTHNFKITIKNHFHRFHCVSNVVRDAGTGGGGGQWGTLAPQLGSYGGADHPTMDCQCRSFLFYFIFCT